VPKCSMILDDLLLLLFSVQFYACCFALVCISRFCTRPQILCWAVTIVAAAFYPFYSVTFSFWMNFCHLKNQISSSLVCSTEMVFYWPSFLEALCIFLRSCVILYHCYYWSYCEVIVFCVLVECSPGIQVSGNQFGVFLGS
jgi:hypothetical protein